MKNEIKYNIGTATEMDVASHLTSCNSLFVPPLSQKLTIKDYAKKIVENSVTFEAWSREELVGLVAAYFNNKEEREGYITNVSVVKDFGGQGIANTLLNNCIDYAIQNKFVSIALEVTKESNGAIALYLKNNFQQTGTQGETIKMKNNLT
ncbi:MAG: GNAT family N-acetyltransferase [Ferruginibacter sp.]